MNAIGTALSRLSLMGQNVAVSGDTHPRWIASYLATVNGNGCIVPIDKEVSTEQTANFLNLSEVTAFIYTAAQNEKARQIADAVKDQRHTDEHHQSGKGRTL